ncbi:hypothetical protein T4D_1754 [Trichinella pseudospiralis]|uniref:Uncharacterized protein n=1 Tax=Trichinella pseudospiralis TaxID=6337 RepID=A0A0V1F731_TRIPS|nr:hypothetical protein T4D_13729 [Trichinella pseudospiralis]KRY81034.1 hypothetical protein T4D_1754 [Trichinella pseudospiralis]
MSLIKTLIVSDCAIREYASVGHFMCPWLLGSVLVNNVTGSSGTLNFFVSCCAMCIGPSQPYGSIPYSQSSARKNYLFFLPACMHGFMHLLSFQVKWQKFFYQLGLPLSHEPQGVLHKSAAAVSSPESSHFT